MMFQKVPIRADHVDSGAGRTLPHLFESGSGMRRFIVPPDLAYRAGFTTHPSTGRRYRVGEAFDYDPVSQVQLITIVFEDVLDPNETFIVPLAHRQLFPAELEAHLHHAGFIVEARWGDFDRTPLRGDSESQIIVARAAR